MAESRTSAGGSGGTLSVHPAASAAPIEALKKGDTLGRYLVLEPLGAGAMGVVYAAYDPELDRKIAVKVLRPHEGKGNHARRQERLVREAKAMAKLSHPNVGAIYDVGVYGDQVFLAMEFLGGGTLRDWMIAKKRPWREIVRMFVEVGKGLACAHAEGLIHRDFKPDNVLLDKNGVPKVVDFGLVRLTNDALDRSTSGSMEVTATHEEEEATLPVAQTALAALTRTGALTGTPAYMASEQFLGKALDARSDQFAFCVALYEAVYGERPFAGDTVLAIADAVTSQRIDAAPKNSDVPNWIRHCLLRGLRVNPSERYPTVNALLAALSTNPVARIRRGAAYGVAALLAIAATIGFQRRTEQRRLDFEQRITARVSAGEKTFADAKATKTRALDYRARAFEAFDRGRREDGERLWSDARAATASMDASLEDAEQVLRSALELDGSRASLRTRLGDVMWERAWLAELEFRKHDVAKLVSRMLDVDGPRLRPRWYEPGTVSLAIPAGARVAIEEYRGQLDGRLTVVSRLTNATSLIDRQLEPGSYRAVITNAAGETINLPFRLRRGGHFDAVIRFPSSGRIPAGFVLVPAGEFVVGEADESLRTSFLDAPPIHEAHTDAFLIATHETTYDEWIEFLTAEPPKQATRHVPFVSTHRDYLRLRRTPESWELELRPATALFTAALGETIRYPARTLRREQRWNRMPVGAISVDDILAFLRWRSRRIPGARLCSDMEWERAARGADDRLFPHGDVLGAADANFDLTYGRKPLAFGPDEVGSHPASRSPFGLEDTAGNLLELTRVGATDEFEARGGGYYFDRQSARVTNREPADRSLRYPSFGFRVCADPPRETQLP